MAHEKGTFEIPRKNASPKEKQQSGLRRIFEWKDFELPKKPKNTFSCILLSGKTIKTKMKHK